MLLLLWLLQARASLTIDTQFVIDTYKKQPQYLSAEKKHDVGIERLSQTKSIFTPNIDLIGSYSHLKTTGILTRHQKVDTYGAYLSATQDVFKSGGLLGQYKKSKIENKITDSNIFIEHQQNIKKLLNLYYDLLSTTKQKSALLESEKIQKEYLQITQRKAKQGNARAYELSQAKSEYLSFQSRLQQIEQDIYSLQQALKLELGIPTDTDLQLEDRADDWAELVGPLIQKSLESYIDLALLQRSESTNSLNNLNLLSTDRTLALSADLPSIGLSASYGYENQDKESLIRDESNYYSIGVNVKIPLFSGLSSLGKRREYAARTFIVEKESLQTYIDIKKEVTLAYSNLKTTLQILESTKDWLETAILAHKQANKSFKVGSIDTSQLLQIQQNKETAELRYAQIKMELAKKYIEFHYSIGESLLALKL